MNTQIRNRTPFYYALYETNLPLVDEDGNYTGESGTGYSDPVLYKKGNVSSATGVSNTLQFGNLEDYDKVIVTADMACPIDENSILWVDTANTSNPHDYVVKRVSKSLNVISIAIKKVKVSNG